MITIILICIMKSHLFAMFVCNFMTTILSVAEILLFIKRWSKIAVANISNMNACITLYALPILMLALSVYAIFE